MVGVRLFMVGCLLVCVVISSVGLVYRCLLVGVLCYSS